MAKREHRKYEVFRKYIYTKATVRKKSMRQDNFRKCSRCHRISKIFQCVINRRRNTNSRMFCQQPYSKLF